MKKTLKMIGVMALLCFFMPVFVSCDKDNDDEPKPEEPKPDEPKPDEPTMDINNIIGSYEGSLGYSVMGFDPGNIDGSYDIQITKDSDDNDEVGVVLPACSFTPPIPQTSTFTIPSLTIDGVDVTLKGDEYLISEDDFSIDVDGVVYTGNLSGTIKDKDANIQYIVRPGRMPMDINFTFTGTLK